MFRMLKRIALAATAAGVFVAMTGCDPREANGPPTETPVEKTPVEKTPVEKKTDPAPTPNP
jgi:hypothetical protein